MRGGGGGGKGGSLGDVSLLGKGDGALAAVGQRQPAIPSERSSMEGKRSAMTCGFRQSLGESLSFDMGFEEKARLN